MGARDVKIYGRNAALALFDARPDDVRRAFVTERALPEVGALLRELAKRRVLYRVVGDAELAKVAGAQHHEGICLVVKPRALADESVFSRDGCAIFVDGVDNPHNIGAILRSAAHFGAIAICGRELPSPAGAVARVAEGGAERVPMVRLDDDAALARIAARGFALIGTAHDARDRLFDAELPRRCVFLVGAEGTGLSAGVRKLAHRMISIPGTGAVESMNVASACAVLLAEHYRRYPR